VEASSLPVGLTHEELDIVQNALNEICNGIAVGEEFETRIGSKLADARAVLAKNLGHPASISPQMSASLQ
jgi:hypothetical protein